MLEEERLPAARLLHDAISDLAELEVDVNRLADAHELADAVDGVDELGEGVESHAGTQPRAGGFSPT